MKALRIWVDWVDDSLDLDPRCALDSPPDERVGSLAFRPESGEMTPIDFACVAAEFAARMLKMARNRNPEICPALFALRVADNMMAAVDSRDLADIDPNATVAREHQPKALMHGESATFCKGSSDDKP